MAYAISSSAALLASLLGIQGGSTIEPAKSASVPRLRFTSFTRWVYDSDLVHRGLNGAQESTGMILGVGASYQSSRSRPVLEAALSIAQPYYTEVSQLNRPMVDGLVALNRRVNKRLTLSLAGDVSTNNYLEDRALSQDYRGRIRLSFRADRNLEVKLGCSYKERYYEDARKNSVVTTAEAAIEHRLDANRSIELGYRRDISTAAVGKFDYVRNGYFLRYTTPTSKTDTLTVGLRLREKGENRPVKGPQRIRDFRSTHQWKFYADWVHPLGDDLDLELSYSYENRASNDIRRDFANHQIVLGLVAHF